MIAELNDRWRRAVADLDNLRKRVSRELEGARRNEREAMISAWLPLVDDLERALAHSGTSSQDTDGLIMGIQAVFDEALQVLKRQGYSRIDETGVRFDPAQHEAVAAIAADEQHPAGTVVEVVRAGWGDKERVLRPASVVVARAPN